MVRFHFKGEYIITVPNAFSFLRDKKFASRVECINSDHRFWFTHYTISKIMYMAGIKRIHVYFASDGTGGNGSYYFIRRFLLL